MPWNPGLASRGIAARHAVESAICLAGANACPPEDVGGSSGYAEFLEVLADPTHEEQAHMLSWAGGAFDLAEINTSLVFGVNYLDRSCCLTKIGYLPASA